MKNNRKILWIAFILVCLLQLYVPARMILDREATRTSGTTFRFKAAPVDPLDPFRGKYITLNFNAAVLKVKGPHQWQNGEQAYALLENDPDGFARIKALSRQAPDPDKDFLKVRIDYAYDNIIQLELPFGRFYMEESKAEPAERKYTRSLRNRADLVYAVVKIRAGDAVLENVMINDVPVSEAVSHHQIPEKDDH